MQLVMFNFLAMFDVVFVFFLFLIGVTCFMNYMPGKRREKDEAEDVESDVIPPPPLFDDDDGSRNRETYVVITPPMDDARLQSGCPVHVV